MIYDVFIETRDGRIINYARLTGDRKDVLARGRNAALAEGVKIKKAWLEIVPRDYVPRTETMKKYIHYFRTGENRIVVYGIQGPSSSLWIIPEA